jgi:L-aspartate oxidase
MMAVAAPDEFSETDVLIIGSGVAGATAALMLADQGVKVVVATSAQDPAESNTYYAQGGIIYRGGGDSPALLAEDITRAGDGHCNAVAVDLLSTEGPPLVETVLFERAPVAFDHDPDGALSLVREGGHSLARILHVADHTGQAIEVALIAELAAHPNVVLLTRHTAVDLLTPAHHALDRHAIYEPLSCVGAYLYDQSARVVRRCMARKTILASGGLGQIFLRTTNPSGARGDGFAMAAHAGARLINMEFVQFHPTTFHMDGAPNLLISEAVRGAGARLVVLPQGTSGPSEPFMARYSPEWKDLAPRDVVSRSIHREMLARGLSHVYLDLRSYIAPDKVLSHFPTIRESLLPYGVDIAHDLVPVVPAAHYECGGVWVDSDGLTSVEDLYAIGEVSCTGVHGANRLASTSLLEGIVWGYRSAQHIAARLPAQLRLSPDQVPPWQDGGLDDPDPALIRQDMSAIKHIMWNYVGLIRTTSRLSRALSELRHLENEILLFYRRSRLTDELIGLRHAVMTAILVAEAAWENKQSMGAHHRE